MAKVTHRIKQSALQLLNDKPEGLRYSEIVRLILAQDPSFKMNTVHGSVWNLDEQYPSQVYKPSRGLFGSPNIAKVTRINSRKS